MPNTPPSTDPTRVADTGRASAGTGWPADPPAAPRPGRPTGPGWPNPSNGEGKDDGDV
ncbi:hypothetical protein [Phytohabitans houttuyneae]|uniref:Uncharacterized protein n=1 Tax=Phytohabitans houttuyneae TaxID=1076126 RepID=A0A6V8K544_9ACTN|nr:hypothetical protein [Phytohabitans houttuyneae]GFJ77438.1 hypothetical protein Phou_016180 [Phytohabitans houttuyneae]